MITRFWVMIVLVVAVWSAYSQPAQVIIIRHADKPADDEDVNLSAKGRRRAAAWVSFLTQDPRVLTNGTPVALFAAGSNKDDHSRRPEETLAPLAKKLELPIQTQFRNRDYALLARELTRNPAYTGKTVLVCWVHDFMPELAGALGIPPNHRKKWKSDDYSRVWLITFKDRRPALQELRFKMKD
jgi:hypothetical protein